MKQKLAKMTLLTALMLTLMLGLTSCDNRTVSDKAFDCALDGDYEKAIVLCTRAIKADPDDFGSYFTRALAYNAMEQYDKAIADFNKMIELQPDEPLTYCCRSTTYLHLEEYDKAMADCNKALTLDSKDYSAYLHRSEVYEAIGKGDLAKADLQKAKELMQTEKEQPTKPTVTPDTGE